MNGSVLLDTNIVIALLNAEPAIRERVAQVSEHIICAVVLGELFYGAYKSRAVKTNIGRIQELAEKGTTSSSLPATSTSPRSTEQCSNAGEISPQSRARL